MEGATLPWSHCSLNSRCCAAMHAKPTCYRSLMIFVDIYIEFFIQLLTVCCKYIRMEIANARSCCSWQRVHLLQGSPYFAGDNAENLGDIEDVNPCWAGVRDSESRRGCLKSQSENGKYFSLLDFDMQPRNNGALTICYWGIVVNIKMSPSQRFGVWNRWMLLDILGIMETMNQSSGLHSVTDFIAA